jgi:hypothetical protein
MTEEASSSSKYLLLGVTRACFNELSLGADKPSILRLIMYPRQGAGIRLSPLALSISPEQKKPRVLSEEGRVHNLTVSMGELCIWEPLIKTERVALSAMRVKAYRHHLFPVT